MPNEAAEAIPEVMTGWKEIERHTDWKEDFWRGEMKAGRVTMKLMGKKRVLLRDEYFRWLSDRPSDPAIRR